MVLFITQFMTQTRGVLIEISEAFGRPVVSKFMMKEDILNMVFKNLIFHSLSQLRYALPDILLDCFVRDNVPVRNVGV